MTASPGALTGVPHDSGVQNNSAVDSVLLDAGLLEQRLLRGYQEQARLYDRLAGFDQQGPAHGMPVNQDQLHDLNAVLKDVAALDAAMVADKEAWLRSERRPGPELAALLERLAERIGTLAARVDRHVADIAAQRGRLVPEIDELIQKRRMLQAYGRYGDRDCRAASS